MTVYLSSVSLFLLGLVFIFCDIEIGNKKYEISVHQ